MLDIKESYCRHYSKYGNLDIKNEHYVQHLPKKYIQMTVCMLMQ